MRRNASRERERRPDRRPLSAVLLLCLILLLVAMTAGVAIGSVGLSPGAVWQVAANHLWGTPSQSVADEIVWSSPRRRCRSA